jgi:hypothetical protein
MPELLIGAGIMLIGIAVGWAMSQESKNGS